MYIFSPNEVIATIQGVLKDIGDQPRTNFMQGFFGDTRFTTDPFVLFDRDFQIRNVISEYVDPDADASKLKLRGHDTIGFEFGYTKEDWSTSEYGSLISRRAGQQIGAIDDLKMQEADQMAEKLRLAYQARENLFEWVATQLLVYGKFKSTSIRHAPLSYDFGRPVLTNATDINGANIDEYLDEGRTPEVDLSSLNANGGVGKRAWNSTGGTKEVSPFTDVTNIIRSASEGAGTAAIIMSANCWQYYLRDPLLEKSADLTKNIALRASLEVLPVVRKVRGLNLMTYHPVGNGGQAIPIFVYNGTYDDRDTGITTSFFPKNYVISVPDPSYGLKIFGRIKHRAANYRPMELYIHSWKNNKTGQDNFQMHTNFVLAHTHIQDVVSWKVLAS